MANTNGNTQSTGASAQLVNCLKKAAERRTNEVSLVFLFWLCCSHLFQIFAEYSIFISGKPFECTHERNTRQFPCNDAHVTGTERQKFELFFFSFHFLKNLKTFIFASYRSKRFWYLPLL